MRPFVVSGFSRTRTAAPRFCRNPLRIAVLAFVLPLLTPLQSAAQIDGSVSVLFDMLPDVSDRAGAQAVGEVRARVFAERRLEIGENLRVHLSAYADGLVRRGGEAVSATTTEAILRPGDLYVELTRSRFDVRAGMSRLVWGRLDELQPTDVVNPIDLTRFMLEGRNEARLPVALLRGRVYLSAASAVELVAVPVFRRSRFDQIGEDTSPFDLVALPGVGLSADEPPVAWNNMQGGARFTITSGRVDWAVSSYSGFRSFPVLIATPLEIVESFPRFVMVGGDFETVRGPWGVRGEAAVFVRDELQSTRAAIGVPGRSVDAGIGMDRRTGDYRVAASVLWSWRGVDASDPLARRFRDDEEVERHDVSLVVAVDRSFARETRSVRLFGVYDPADDAVFGRAIVSISLRDNLALEASAGLFAGDSLDIIGRLTRRDFLYVRLKAFF